MIEKVYNFSFYPIREDLINNRLSIYIISSSLSKAAKVFKKKFPSRRIKYIETEDGKLVPSQYVKKLNSKYEVR